MKKISNWEKVRTFGTVAQVLISSVLLALWLSR